MGRNSPDRKMLKNILSQQPELSPTLSLIQPKTTFVPMKAGNTVPKLMEQIVSKNRQKSGL